MRRSASWGMILLPTHATISLRHCFNWCCAPSSLTNRHHTQRRLGARFPIGVRQNSSKGTPVGPRGRPQQFSLRGRADTISAEPAFCPRRTDEPPRLTEMPTLDPHAFGFTLNSLQNAYLYVPETRRRRPLIRPVQGQLRKKEAMKPPLTKVSLEISDPILCDRTAYCFSQ